MEKNTSQLTNSEPTICRGCKTFYGNPQHHNMCSKCFRDSLGSDNKNQSTQLKENSAETAAHENNKKMEPIKQDKSRCMHCSKKTGLLGFECKCGFSFCKNHRMPESHNCGFDHMAHEKKILERNNPVIKSEKLEKF